MLRLVLLYLLVLQSLVNHAQTPPPYTTSELEKSIRIKDSLYQETYKNSLYNTGIVLQLNDLNSKISAQEKELVTISRKTTGLLIILSLLIFTSFILLSKQYKIGIAAKPTGSQQS